MLNGKMERAALEMANSICQHTVNYLKLVEGCAIYVQTLFP